MGVLIVGRPYSLKLILLMKQTGPTGQTQFTIFPKTQQQDFGVEEQAKTRTASTGGKTGRYLCGTDVDLQNKLKKQVKQYLRQWRGGAACKTKKDGECAVQLLLDLVRGQSHFRQEINNTSNFSQKGSDCFTTPFGRISRSHRPKIVIVGPQDHRNKTCLRLAVIDYTGKIEYFRHSITRLSELHIVINQIQRAFKYQVLVVHRMELIQQMQGKNYLKLHKILKDWEQLDLDGLQGAPAEQTVFLRMEAGVGKQKPTYNKFQHHCKNALTKFYLIEAALQQNSVKLQSEMTSQVYINVFPFAYNILAVFVQPGQGSFSTQVQYYLLELQQVLRSLSQQPTPQQKDTQLEDHYPVPLANAQVCWRCKVRGFISCSTCSKVQGKTIPLCLDCYATHHQTLRSPPQNEAAKSMVSTWQQVEMEVTKLIEQEQWAMARPGLWLIKKQESE